MTLKRRLNTCKSTEDLNKATKNDMGRFIPVVSNKQEKELASYVKQMESSFFSLTTKDLKCFDSHTKMAGTNKAR